MPEDYTQAQLMTDLMSVITENAPVIIGAAILIAVVNFVIAWFMDSINLADRAFGRRR